MYYSRCYVDIKPKVLKWQGRETFAWIYVTLHATLHAFTKGEFDYHVQQWDKVK